MRIPVLLTILLSLAAVTHADNGNMALAAPTFLQGPQIANTMIGTTYAYRARELQDPTALQITVVDLPPEIRAQGFSPEHCIQLFLTEIARNRKSFFAVPVTSALHAGPIALQQVRWTRKDGAGMTGVTGCGIDGDRYVAVNFQDATSNASHTFPAIRASLEALELRH